MKKLEVRLSNFPSGDLVVGTLVTQDRSLFFEYDNSFLTNPLWLSPFKLPPEKGLQEHKDLGFGPIFGVFDDSLPDGWGLLLMDRYFRQKGIDLQEITVLHRLAYLGNRTMGALTYHPPDELAQEEYSKIDLHLLNNESQDIIQGKCKKVLPLLLKAGGSPGGARPKVLVGLKGRDMISGEYNLPKDYEHWMIKFYSNASLVEEGLVEYAYSLMARAADIQMATTKLFSTDEGENFFGVKRFDRKDGKRLHIHTLGNLIHSNFRIPSCDYEDLLKATRILTKNDREVNRAFRLMVFNILTNNRDDHVKNFAFLMRPTGEWELAPAYDLTYSLGPGGEHSLTVLGEGKNPSKEHCLALAQKFSISTKTAREHIKSVIETIENWDSIARKIGISSKMRETVKRNIDDNLARF